MTIVEPALVIQHPPLGTLPAGSTTQSTLIFVVAGRRYAVRIADVLEVTPAAALMSPSGHGSMLVGYLDLRGEVLPVIGARQLLALPVRPLELSDRFIVVRAVGRRVAIVVDRVEGVEDVALVAGPGPDPADGLTVGRRVGSVEDDALVTFVSLDRLLAGAFDPQTDATAR